MARLLAFVCAIRLSNATPGKIYWADSGHKEIRRANVDGSAVETVVPGLSRPEGVAIDASSEKIYWTDAGTKKIQRCSMDGSDLEDLVTLDGGSLAGIDLDLGAGKMYWADEAITQHKVQRANLDGSGLQDFVVSNLKVVSDVAVARGHGRVYWTDSLNQHIESANLQGSDRYIHIECGFTCSPVGLVLDEQSNFVIWADTYKDKLRKSSFTHRSTLDEPPMHDVVSGLQRPTGLALDTNTRMLYWTDSQSQNIQRRSLNGGSVEDIVLRPNCSNPRGIAVVPESTTTSTLTTTTITSLTRTRTTLTRVTATHTTSTASTVTTLTTATTSRTVLHNPEYLFEATSQIPSDRWGDSDRLDPEDRPLVTDASASLLPSALLVAAVGLYVVFCATVPGHD